MVLVDPAHAEDWVRPAPKEQVLIDRGVRLCRYGAGRGENRSRTAGDDAGQVRTVDRWHEASSKPQVAARSRSRTKRFSRRCGNCRQASALPLAHFWSKPRFFEALGSQIGSISVSAAQVLEATAGGFGDLPLTTIRRPILATTACDSRTRWRHSRHAAAYQGIEQRPLDPAGST